jgi:hypothetical protein
LLGVNSVFIKSPFKVINHTLQGSVFTLISTFLLPLPDGKTDTEREGIPHSVHSWAASQLAFSYTLIQHLNSILLPEPEKHGFTPKMAVTRMSLWEVIKLSFGFLWQVWVTSSLMSGAPLPLSLVPAPHWVLCIQGPQTDSPGG